MPGQQVRILGTQFRLVKIEVNNRRQGRFIFEIFSAINRAGFILETLARTLTYVASQCVADALKHCPEVNLGEERVLNCLSDNKAKLTKYCGLALSDIGRQ